MERKVKIAPSLLAADILCLKDEVAAVEATGVEYLHFDIMDGHFVPNITFGPSVIKSLRPLSKLVFDVHLMIEKPERYIKEFIDAGADIITVHAEACVHLDRTLQMIRDLGAKSAVALNPATHHSVLDYVWNKLDMVLLMSVNPGFGGQQFIQSVLRKSYEIYSRINEMSCSIDLEIDGGISQDNAKQVVHAGCNVLVAGTSIFGKKPLARAVKNIRDMAMEGL